jgi:uncharacterized RDD family membrane protein YckC
VGYATSASPVLQGREFAGWWARVGAALIDTIIAILLIITIVGPFIYGGLTMGRKGENNGQTFGKQALGIRVLREDGQEWTFGTGLLRELVIKGLLFGTVGSFFFGLPTLINYLWPLWDEKKQALHDKLATSYVVKA